MGRIIDTMVLKDDRLADVVKKSLEQKGFNVRKAYYYSIHSGILHSITLTVIERGMYDSKMAPPAPKRRNRNRI